MIPNDPLSQSNARAQATHVKPTPLLATPASPFKWDYSALDDDVRQAVRSYVMQINQLQKRMVTDAVTIGNALIAVKSRLQHGDFVEWVEAEFSWSRDTAEHLMNLAKRAHQIPNYSAFGLTVLFQLTAPSATPEFVEAVLVAEDDKRALENRSLTVAEVKAIHAPDSVYLRYIDGLRAVGEEIARDPNNPAIPYVLNETKELLRETSANGGLVANDGVHTAAGEALSEATDERRKRRNEHIAQSLNKKRGEKLMSGQASIVAMRGRFVTLELQADPVNLGVGQIINYGFYDAVSSESEAI